MDEHQKQLY